VIDGDQQLSGRKKADIAPHISTANAARPIETAITLSRVDSGAIRVQIDAGAYDGAVDVMLVQLDARHDTVILAGENKARNLANYNVVRMLHQVATCGSEWIYIAVRLMEIHDAARDFCAVFVQERGQGRIIGAALLNLRTGELNR
jgi:hypothetical protein